MSAVNDVPTDKPNGDLVASNNKPISESNVSQPVAQPVAEPRPTESREREVKQADTKPADSQSSGTAVAKNDKPVFVPTPAPVKESPKVNESPLKPEVKKDVSPLDVGPLIAYATKQPPPVYPSAARSIRVSGVVRVDLTVDENGEVADVQKSSGPALLQAAAKDAIRKWKFRPFVRDGQPVRAVGFVSFNFAL